MAAAHGAAFAASLASILDAGGKPARELVTSTAYEHGDSWCELKSIEISVFGRVDTLDGRGIRRCRSARSRALPPVIWTRSTDRGHGPQQTGMNTA
jgi:hypothetical protein